MIKIILTLIGLLVVAGIVMFFVNGGTLEGFRELCRYVCDCVGVKN